MRRRLNRRRLMQEPADINITAFMNLMVILVPFLLITAVFTRITVLELNLPAAAEHEQHIQQPKFDLEIIVRDNSIAVGDRSGGLLSSFPRENGEYDYEQLSLLLQQIKARFPEKLDATLLLESDTSYDTLVQVMDRVRVAQVVQAGSVQSAELFPEISIGDAPQTSTRMAGK
ncbi:MAG: biopolymer transporter ExbD [Gammaproteobacteria bacterium]|nr:biopolymer transporter ExbD [Gammaproteobacteria bacterium]